MTRHTCETYLGILFDVYYPLYVTVKKSPPAKVKRGAILGEDQQILALMFENIITKIDGIDYRVLSLHDSTKDGLRDIGERLARVETMQTNLEASVKTMDGRIQRVEAESVRTSDLNAVHTRIVGLENEVKLHSQVLSSVPALQTELNTFIANVNPARTFFDRARWLWVGLSGILGSVVTTAILHYLFSAPSF